MNYSIGIGVTTTPNRSDYFKECLKNIHQYSDSAKLYVHNDRDGKGVAYSKNMCLYNLQDCDFIFLFDDDCYPIKHNWIEYMIETMQRTGEKHFLFLNERLHGKPEQLLGYQKFENCGGVFMAFDLFRVYDIMYMDERYKRWGFEHAGLSQRIYRAGNTSAPFLMPNRLNEYIYARDYDEKVETRSSLTEAEKKENYQFNQSLYLEERTTGEIFKQFKP